MSNKNSIIKVVLEDQKDDNMPLLKFFIEDDGNWCEEMVLSSYYLEDIIQELKEIESHLFLSPSIKAKKYRKAMEKYGRYCSNPSEWKNQTEYKK